MTLLLRIASFDLNNVQITVFNLLAFHRFAEVFVHFLKLNQNFTFISFITLNLILLLLNINIKSSFFFLIGLCHVENNDERVRFAIDDGGANEIR